MYRILGTYDLQLLQNRLMRCGTLTCDPPFDEPLSCLTLSEHTLVFCSLLVHHCCSETVSL